MRAALPYIVAAVCLAGLGWALAVGRLPPADFTFCNGDEIKTVDPALTTGQPEGRIVWSIFEGLVSWDPETLEPRPGVARAWTVSDDKRTYTFELRHDARWTDGTPVTAEDFAWSFRRFLHPATAAQYAKEMWYVEGARKYTASDVEPGDDVEVELTENPAGALPFAAGKIVRGKLLAVEQDQDDADAKTYVVEIDGQQRRFRKGTEPARQGVEPCAWILYDFNRVGIRAPDRWTVEVRLRHPVPYFVNLMGFYPMSPVNRRCVETHGYPAWTKPENIVTNGPFRLEFRRIRDRIRLLKSPTYWDRDNVHLEVIDALAVNSYPTMLNLYMTGQADWIETVPPEVVPELMKRPQGDFRPVPYLGTYYYLLNTTKPPLDDVRVRRALGLALNKQQVVTAVTRAGQKPALSYVPAGLSKYVDYTPALCGAYDPQQAKRTLTEAGYPGGRGMPELEILYNTSEAHKAIAVLVQTQWKRSLGVDVSLTNQEWTAYQVATRKKNYQVARAAWIGDYTDPNTFLDMWVTDGTHNYTGWSNPEYDRLVDAAQQEQDVARRMDYFHQAERILMDEMPIIPIYSYVSQSMVRPYVKGFYRNIQDVHPLKHIRIDQGEKARVLEEEGLR